MLELKECQKLVSANWMDCVISWLHTLKKVLWPFLIDWVQLPQEYRVTTGRQFTTKFLPLSLQKFLVLIWSTSEGWKAESTLKPPSGIKTRNPFNLSLLYHPSYYKIQIKATICQTVSTMTLNCELYQSEFSVSSGRLIIILPKICFLSTDVEQMIIQQIFNILLQLYFYNIFTNVLSTFFKSFHWHFKDLWTT